MLSLEKVQNKQVKFVVPIVLTHVLTKYKNVSSFNIIIFRKNIEQDSAVLDDHVQNSKYLCTSDAITCYMGMKEQTRLCVCVFLI